MNELDLVRATRAGIPAPTPERVAIGRERLLAAISPAPASRRAAFRLPRNPIRVAAALGVAAAVAIVATSGLDGGGRRRAAVTTTPMSLAASVLHRAAVSAADRSSALPRPGQWLFARTVSYSLGAGRRWSDSWVRFDGREEAYYQGGRLVVHGVTTAPASGTSPVTRFLARPTSGTAYKALASLPHDPTRLLAAVAKQVLPASIAGSGWDPAGGRGTRAQLEFGFLADLLWNAAQAAAPRAETDAFQAMATIPGVRAQRSRADALRRPAIALSIAGVDQELLLSPRTYRVTGERTLSNGRWPAPANKRGATVPAGRVVQSLAWASVRFVSGPGER